jgi:hypothetical protein
LPKKLLASLWVLEIEILVGNITGNKRYYHYIPGLYYHFHCCDSKQKLF